MMTESTRIAREKRLQERRRRFGPDMSARVCRACGLSEGHAGEFCVMSRGGEGPHRFEERTPRIAGLADLAKHYEQGGRGE